ncbi:acetyltransferase [Lithospermum erythrorhizon]|uniref:Acetyltransferase n=1 Tax=Lithospermum erythrorhizon TaxID=34254 RepID=A0AAV3P0X3_LITER
MAHLPSNPPNVPQRILQPEFSWKCSRGTKQYYVGLLKSSRKCSLRNKKSRSNKRVVPCSSSAEQVNLAGEMLGKYGDENGKGHFHYLVSDDHGWKVRRMDEVEAEMKEVANIQAEAFHEPVALFNDMFFDFFQAEVLSGLLYKLRNWPQDRYACLVAEASLGKSSSKEELVGVVDATVYCDNDVLMHIPGADEYLYVSGIAVLNKFRRQKVATALLKACDILARLWRFDYLALRAYEDDSGARRLYTNAGYRVVSSDPLWVTWIGRRRRVLMIKGTDHQIR